MAIDYDNKEEIMTMECDVCEDAVEIEGTFAECIKQAKEDGWIVYLADDDTWTHLCSNSCRQAQTE